MKRFAVSMLISILLGLASCVSVYSQAKVVVRETITITVNKAQVQTDVPPITVQDLTLVPVRGVFNAFNASIDWLPVEHKVHITRDDQEIWLTIGEDHADVNGKSVPLDVTARIYRGRTMVPLRFLAETLGATVDYDAATQTISITEHAVATPTPVTEPEVTPEPDNSQ